MMPGDIFELIEVYNTLNNELKTIGVRQVAQDLKELHQLLELIHQEHGSLKNFVEKPRRKT